MKGKADKLVANRTLSALIVLCVVLSGFAGFIFLSKSTPTKAASIGDLTILNERYVIEGIEQPVDGNVTVGTGGELVIKDATLSIISNNEPLLKRSIKVENNGKLTLDHGTITTYLDQIDPWPFLTLTVQSGGQLVATGDSFLMFPGYFNITSSATVTLYDTTITSLSDELVNQFVAGSTIITIDSANDGPAITVTNAKLSLFDSSILRIPSYPVDMAPARNIVLSGTASLLGVNSYIGVDFVSSVYNHNAISLSGGAIANLYGCVFETYTGTEPDRTTAIIGPYAYIYRWLNVTVGDEYGVPIPGADVSAVFTGSETYGGMASFYFDDVGATSSLPQASVLDYMGKDALTFGVTESDGIAVIPYLTDLILTPEAPNSLFVGSFSITGTSTVYSSTQNFSFQAYPAMTYGDTSDDFTVSIVGISAPSPDPSRWLVVPPSLTISDLTYYHAGDVIVAAGGTLRIENAVFDVVQRNAFQRTVYVDNATASGAPGAPTLLVLEKAVMRSNVQLNINVKGYATLAVFNSSLESINIVADEHAKVVLMNSSMQGQITTGWDAYAAITVKDSDLSQAPVLSGHSAGSFTNSSAPGISVEDEAIGLIYRWIHITVLDGAGKPLPGVLVSTRYYINNTPANSAVSSAAADSLGVAKVNALSTILTSVRERLTNNYMVNASYTYRGTTFYADEEKPESVLPYYYGQSLGRNATYDTMKISGVLPSLIPAVGTSVWANVSYPKQGQNVTMYAKVLNDGYSSAYDVRVDFYDDLSLDGIPQANELFGTNTIPVIRAGETQTTSASWIAVPPLDPNPHSIIAVIDPERTILELNETPSSPLQMGFGEVIVRNLPDIAVQSAQIWSTPAFIIIGGTVTLQATIWNYGSNVSTAVTVEFYDGPVFIDSTVLAEVPALSSVTASITWTPTEVRAHQIRVEASLGVGYEELDLSNNAATAVITVYNNPNLKISEMKTSPSGSVPGGDTVTVTVRLENLEAAPFSNPWVMLYANYTAGTEAKSIVVNTNLTGITLSSSSGYTNVALAFSAPMLAAMTTVDLVVIANPAHSPVESDYTNNILVSQIVVLDVRPDLSIVTDDMYVTRQGTNITGETYGKVVVVNAVVRNLGGSNATGVDVEMGVRNAAGTYNYTFYKYGWVNVSWISPSNTALVSVQWTINLTVAGDYQIWVRLDSPNSISEPNEANNFATHPFTIQQLYVTVSMTTDAEEYTAGDMMVISASIVYFNTNDAVKSLPGVVFWLIDSTTSEPVPNSNSSVQTTDATGSMVVLLRIPANLDTGSYKVRAVVLGENHDSSTAVHVSAAVSGGLFPWWVWLLIIVAVVAIVAGFTVYTYVYGLGKLVECGECGAFIPAASKRCPKCGVEFESGTMKCSECGAWIPSESTECPNCGVKFVGAPEEEADYVERMRKEYDEMVSKYRELARPELGRKYSEKAFELWWKAQPGYISFEDWLAKQEQKKKEGPIPCPVCGTLNPKEATVCHKCGTVFGAARAAPPERRAPPPAAPPAAVEGAPPAQAPPEGGAPPAAPRMVIRRPIDRKVVPKKIIKTPVGGEEEQSGSGGEDENQ